MKPRLVLILFLALLLGGCAANAASQTSGFSTPIPNRLPSRDNGQGVEAAPTVQAGAGQMQVVLAPSEITVGPDRFAVGLFTPAGEMIHHAAVHFTYYDLSDPNAVRVESEADAVQLQTPDGLTTLFAHERNFDRAGNWGVAVQARLPDGTTTTQRIAFQVLASSPTLKVGQKAPALDTPTAADVNGDLKQLTSDANPDPAFYRLSLAQALKSGKPTAFLLATPAFCQSRLCGPDYEMLAELEKRFGNQLNLIHVEVYTGLPDPSVNNWQLTPAMQAFGLQTEPWLYLIGKDGAVSYRVEGLFTADEIAGRIQSLLNSN